MLERYTIVGDISGIRSQDLNAFINATRNHQYLGSFPVRQEAVPDEAVIEKTSQILTQAGILDLSPIKVCSSTDQKAKEILDKCCLCSGENGSGRYWVLDQNPTELVEAMASVVNGGSDLQTKEILRRMSIIKLGSPSGADYRDPKTNIRIGLIPVPCIPYPMHPGAAA